MYTSLRKLYFTSNRLLFMLFLIIYQSSIAQCPTVTNASQTFCNTESPTIANLVATNNGGGVAWFSSTSSTTPLSPSTGLTNGVTYYADNAAGNCGTRQAVTVTIYSAPLGQNFQGVCVDDSSQATIANLIAVGNNINWYTTSSGGSPLPTTTVLVDNTIYYASQTNPNTGCETSRLSVFVTVGVVPVPVGPSIQSFCVNGSTPTVADLQASGTNNWYSTNSSAVVLDPTTPLVNGENYYATTLDPPCESVNRLEVTVQLLQPNNAGTDGAFAVCSNALTVNPIRNLFSSLGGNPQAGGTWTGPLATTNGDQGTVNISTLNAAGSPYVFTYTVTNAACPTDTATVTITVSNPANAGNDATTTVCSNSPSFNLFALLGSGAQSGGTWSPALSSGTNTFNPAVDASGVYTYTVLGAPGCPNDTATVNVTVNPATNSGTNGAVTVCAVGPSTNLFTSLGGTPQSGGTWSPALASGTGVFNPLIDPAGTYTYTVTGIAPCTNSSSTVVVTVTPATNPTFTQVAPICQGGTLSALPTTSNNGVTGTWTPALNNNATTTYTFTPTAGQCATTATMTITVNPNLTPTFTQVPPICRGGTLSALPTTSNNGVTGTWSPALNNNNTTTYTFTPTAGQCATTATMTITVNPNLTPTFTQVPPICRGGTLSALPTTSNNGVTGTWSPALNNNNTTTYTFTPTAGQCATTATMTITVNPNVTPTFTQVAPICQGGTLSALPTTSNNGVTGTWSPALNNNATTTYTFTPAAGQCATTATMTITVNPNVTPTFTQVAPICQGGTLSALPTTSNNGVTGTWSPALNNNNTTTYTFTPAAGQCATTATMTITVNPNLTPTFTQVPPICRGGTLSALPTTSNNGITGTWSPALNNNATTTYTFTPAAGQCATTATMTITVNPNVTPTFTQVAPICQGGTLSALPTTSNNGVTGTWSPALNNNATTTYTFTPTAGQCATTATITITVNPNVTPTFTQVAPICQGGTLSALPTTSNNGVTGTWSPALNNNATTTYTFTPAAGQCATTATMTITVNPNVTPTFTQVAPICQGGTLSSLPTTSNNGVTGTWSPALNNNATTTYTFTPAAGQCATTATMTITVNPNVTPTFTQVAPICQGGTLSALPTTSNNGITGTWSPALNNNATTTYTFTPTAGQCATTATMTITVNPNVTPTFTQVAPICQGGTLAALPTTSNNGVTGTWSPALNNNATTTYTFTPTAGQCATTATMTITVNPNVTPTFTQVAPICQGGTLAALPTTSNNGVTGTWSPALNNNATTTYTFTPAAGQCATTATMTITVNPNVTPTFTQVAPICQGGTLSALPTTSNNGVTGTWSPALNNNATTTYTFTPTAGQCATTATITITVNPNVTPTFTQVAPICQGGTLSALPTTSNNGVTGTWSPALNNNATTTYTFTPTAGQCATTASMTITVNPNVTPTFTQVAPICQGGTLSALPTTSNNGITGTWSPALNNNATTTYTFTPTAGQCATTATMTITVNPNVTPTFTQVAPICQGGTLSALPTTSNNGVTGTWSPALNNNATTTYTFTPTAGQCATTATMTITVNPNVTPTFTQVAPICQGGTLSALPTTSNNGITGTWSPALNNNNTTTYTFTPNSTVNCEVVTTMTIVVNPIPNAGTDGSITLCSNATPTDLFSSLGGTPMTGGTWSPALASGTGVFNPAVDAAGTYTYTVTGTAPCGSDTAEVVVTIIQAPNAGTDGTATFCADSTPADLFTFLGGTPQTGGTWTPALASGTGVFNPAVDTAGTYTYTVTGTAPCANGTASATVTVNPIPNAGTDGSVTLCSNATPTDLFSSLGGTPMTGGTWSPALASGTGVFNPAVDAAGTYTYTVTGTAPCGSDTAEVVVTIIQAPNAGTDGTATFCADSTPADLFTFLGGTPQTGGTWTPALASGTGVFNPAVDTAGTYTYTVTGTAPCANGTASATVTVNPIPNAGTDGSITLCSNATPTDLFSSLGGTPMTGGTWSPALASGTGVFNPAVDAAGTYTYTVTGTAPCGSDTAEVVVTIIQAPNAGTDGTATFCADSTPADLFTFLGGTPQTGGTWTPALASGTGVFNPAVDTAGTYTYTVTGSAPCANGTASATVTVNPIPNAGTDGLITLCSNATPTDLFSSLGGTPMTGGTWSPALASGTGVFNPAVDAAGTYTYTVTGTAPCGSDTAEVVVTIIQAPNAGTDGTATFCADSTPADLFTFLGGTPQTGGTWTPALASGTGVFNPAVDTAGTYTYTVTGTAPCANGTASATVTVNPIPNAGTDGSVTLCSNATPTDLFSSLGGTPMTGGTWSPALASGTGVFNPAVDAAGTYTYTVTGTAPCGSDTAEVVVTIIQAPNAGTDGTATFCADSTPADLFTFLGGTPQTGGTWTPALASGTGVFNPAVDTAGTYTYTVTGTAPCANGTASATVTVNPIPNAGTDGSITLCSNATPTDLFSSLGGTPMTGGTWSPALASGTGVFNPAVDAAGTYTYTVTGTAPCGSDTAQVVVTITPGPNAGSDGTITLCSNATPVDLFATLGTLAQTGGTWSPPLTSGTGVFNPAFDPAGIYTYTIPGVGTCNVDTAIVTVNLTTPPNFGAGTISAVNSCQNSNVIITLSGSSLTDGSYLFDYSVSNANPSTGTTTAVVITSGSGQFSIPGSYFQSAGPVTVTLNAVTSVSGSCTTSNLGVATAFTILPVPSLSNATVTVSTVCLGNDATVSITGATLLTNGTYTFDYQITGANTASTSVSVGITNGSGSFILPASVLTNSGISQIIINSIVAQSTSCGNSSLNFSPVSFTVENPDTPTLTGNATFCSDASATISDLIAQITGNGTILIYATATGGTALNQNDLIQDGITYYTAVITSAGCESSRLPVTVILESCIQEIVIPDGFSPNGDGINDEFVIKNIVATYPNFKIEIFNRYGNVLFKGDKNNPNWNGLSSEGTNLGNGYVPAGVYFFVLEFNDGARAPLQGRLYLSR